MYKYGAHGTYHKLSVGTRVSKYQSGNHSDAQ